MSKKYLILDCPYLCHRAKYTTGDLNYDKNATGTVFGFLKTLSVFQDLFRTSDFLFCWDSKRSKRKEIYPDYKANRTQKEYTEDEIEFDKNFRKQIKKLRTEYLPMIGFKNNFIQPGYEADDVIASLCQTISKKKEIIIITADKDLYQCIRPNISFYNPQKNKRMTLQKFKKLHDIHPDQWSIVKELAGCSTDNVKGIEGVGEKTALKYLTNKLGKKTKAYQSIINDKIIYSRNRNLVQLPFLGTWKFKVQKDELSKSGWKEVTELLGMKSLKSKMPFGIR